MQRRLIALTILLPVLAFGCAGQKAFVHADGKIILHKPSYGSLLLEKTLLHAGVRYADSAEHVFIEHAESPCLADAIEEMLVKIRLSMTLIGHNIANASLPGYRRRFDAVGLLVEGPGLVPTGSPFSFAIEGRGYFRLKDKNRGDAYTRNGLFALDAEWRLADDFKRPLADLAATPFPEDWTAARFHPNGLGAFRTGNFPGWRFACRIDLWIPRPERATHEISPGVFVPSAPDDFTGHNFDSVQSMLVHGVVDAAELVPANRAGLDLSQGDFFESRNPHHVALNGPGFFVVELPENRGIGLTREGTVVWDDAGFAATRSGCRHAGPVNLPPEKRAAMIVLADGSVTAPDRDAPFGKFVLACVPNPDGLLWDDGFKVYRPTADSGQPFVVDPLENGASSVNQFFQEKSNVRPERERAIMRRLEEALYWCQYALYRIKPSTR